MLTDAIALFTNSSLILSGCNRRMTTSSFTCSTMPRNPHATDRVAGGSSTGSAVAVATGLVPLAMGGAGRLLAPRWRQHGVRVAGSFILVLGLVTLGRGVLPMTAGHGLHHFWHVA